MPANFIENYFLQKTGSLTTHTNAKQVDFIINNNEGYILVIHTRIRIRVILFTKNLKND